MISYPLLPDMLMENTAYIRCYYEYDTYFFLLLISMFTFRGKDRISHTYHIMNILFIKG